MPCRRRTNMIFLFFHQILFFSRWIVHSSSLLDFFLCSLMLQTDLPSRIKCSLLSFSLVRSLDATNNIYIPFTKPFTRSIQLNCRISNFWHEKKKISIVYRVIQCINRRVVRLMKSIKLVCGPIVLFIYRCHHQYACVGHYAVRISRSPINQLISLYSCGQTNLKPSFLFALFTRSDSILNVVQQLNFRGFSMYAVVFVQE